MSNSIIRFIIVLVIGVFFIAPSLSAEDEYSFDLDEFTKKTWEWKGEVQALLSSKNLNQESAPYLVKFPEKDKTVINDAELRLIFDSRWDWEWSRLYLVGEAFSKQSSLEDSDVDGGFLREGYWQFSLYDPNALDIGKRLLRWGKGYAFNPVALMERKKNPANPESDREGLWATQFVWISGAFSVFDASSVTLVYLPISEAVNDDFREDTTNDDSLQGLKLYGLLGTTDIDVYIVRREQYEELDIGFDFSTNLSANFEVHGEYVKKEYADTTVDIPNTELSLIGLRYLNENETTFFLEAYQDSSALTVEESKLLYEKLETSPPKQKKAILNRIQSGSTLNRRYGYAKVSISEPFGFLYFTPSLAMLSNLDDHSKNGIIQAKYAPGSNYSFQLTFQSLSGEENTQYGEFLNKDKTELQFTYSF